MTIKNANKEHSKVTINFYLCLKPIPQTMATDVEKQTHVFDKLTQISRRVIRKKDNRNQTVPVHQRSWFTLTYVPQRNDSEGRERNLF